MALTDQVIMPGSDYQAICDATRTLTGKTATLKSGDISTELGTVLKKPETWIINEVPNFPSSTIRQKLPFIALSPPSLSAAYNYSYSNFIIDGRGMIIFQIAGTRTSAYRDGQWWKGLAYRRVSFLTSPSGDLLAWLTDNAVKMTDDESYSYNVQESLDHTVNGISSVVITPTPPYDSLREVIVTTKIVEQAKPSIYVNTTTGEITSTVTQTEAGWVKEGTKTATKQLPTVDAASIAAGTSLSLYSMRQEVGTSDVSAGIAVTSSTNEIANSYVQESSDSTTVVYVPIPTETKTVALSMASGNQTVINSTGEKLMTAVTVQKPSTLIPSNIKKGVEIGGVVGAIPEIDATNLLDGVLTSNGSIGIAGDEVKMGVYLSLDPSATLAEGHMILPEIGAAVKSVTIPTEQITITPSWTVSSSSSSYDPTSRKLIRRVVVNKPSTLIPSNIKNGVEIGGIAGTYTGDSIFVRDVDTINATTSQGAITFTTSRLARYLCVRSSIGYAASADIRSLSSLRSVFTIDLNIAQRRSTYYYTWSLYRSDESNYDGAKLTVYIIYD